MYKKDDAVSPVIGVILMVAITVILAAVIAAFVFGMAGNVQSTKSVAAVAEQTDSGTIQVTYHGGKDHTDVSNLNITWPNSNPVSVASPPNVGQVFTNATAGTPNKDRIIVTAKFVDGKEQVILDTTV
ncbi:MAG: type IV pilin [Methanomicrobiales archaeon]|nr:type IV pilin [Methanomicrobiales archaeon]